MIFFLICVVAMGCGNESGANKIGGNEANRAEEKSLSIDERVEKILSSMTLTEKIGQLVMIGVQGTEPNADSLYMLHQFHFGGVILFDRNMESAAQVRRLTRGLDEGADEKLPMFFALDEEGGDVVRMSDALTPPPSEAELGARGDSEAVHDWAKKTGASLKEMGINVNFAPVVDVATDASFDTRSYSRDAHEVARLADAAARGYEDAGIFCALKHFPGIGRGAVDSHREISSIDATKGELMAQDLVPYREVFARHASDELNYFVLVSHLLYPALDDENGASLSHAVMTGLLRNELGYRGLIVTDDMEMGAVQNHHTFREVGAKAIEAGADIVLVCHEYEHEEDVYMGILDAVKRGEIKEERIDESVRRIIKAKLLHLK